MSEQILYREPNSWSAAVRGLCLPAPLCFVFFSAIASAAPEPYGMYFVRLQEQLPGQDSALEVSDSAATNQNQAPYQSQMQAMELRNGPYADALAEPLAALGRLHRQEGNYGEALASYRRALHIIRVNDGLYSERQIPVLRELLLTFRETGDFESLDSRYEYLFRLYGMGQPPYTELRVRAALEYLRWQREALLLDIGTSQERRIIELIKLNGDLLTRVMADPVQPFAWKRDLAYSQLANLYLLQDRFEPSISESQLVPASDPFGAKPMVAEMEDQRIDNLLRGAPAKGRVVLQDLQAEAAVEGAVELAALELALGDWQHWNGNGLRAREAYQSVITRLREAGELALIQQWFGEPVELPDNRAFLLPEPSLAEDGGEVRALFDVSKRGKAKVRSTELLTGEPGRSLSDFRRKLGGTLFRPRWENGEVRAATGVQRDYRLLD